MNSFNLTNRILGRISSHIAKLLLSGESVEVSNVEEVLITGSKADIIQKYKHRVNLGTQRKGPFIKRSPEGLFSRTVSRMIPKKKRDRLLANLKFLEDAIYDQSNLFVGVPLNGMYLGDLCSYL